MFKTRAELLEKIRLGEDNYLELKEVRFAGGRISGPMQKDIADEIAAFSNAQGGVLLLGVHDKTREVLGVPVDRLDDVEAMVRQACEDSIDPPAAPVIERMNLPDIDGVDKAILRLDIPKSLSVHESPGGYYHRVGSSKRKIPPDQLSRLFQHRSQAGLIKFDETRVPSATLDDLDQQLWRHFALQWSQDTMEVMLSKMAMASQDDEGVWRPTVAGILLACPKPEQFLPNAFVQAVAYRGKTISIEAEAAYQRDAQDITGPVDQQIFDTCDFVRKNMFNPARKGLGGGRMDIPQFDMEAVFEAVTNAVAHRDYSMTGSKIRLRLFDDRLELYTPGMLSNTMKTENFAGRQSTRNEAIASQLARCPIERDHIQSRRTHIMDRRGEGVYIILSKSEELSGKKPEYRMIDESELLLTIYAAEVSPEPEEQEG